MVFFKKKEFLSLNKANQDIKKDVEQIKEEFNEHLDSINENTNEIQANYTYLTDLDKRISKLNDKFDEMSMMLKQIMEKNTFFEDKNTKIKSLNPSEKKIFLILYTSEKLLSYRNLAISSALTETLASQYITSMIEKGVPIVKQYNDGKPHIGLDSQFKELQAKKNLVNLG